ncbi:putative mannosidase MNL2 KNAG_0L00310 [Huiozyma naganishii CBS 8797]|uniref:alpha-1,2-Mannosidase n=1 Tax=Huiozyma naganishii (strain ATCC MYA-139 / BCRC 22969 / CBS 8797 / KCTC 17520 / NBRC 10181 / NCYC 3082 / Yp74L-3) TaxID=1071383 RepID=J7SAD2_HUIN7|nr:hypothetical protein KNAG_0L00310 [Kazachstania naganishii CBS 8797]CCK72654.1 hypothetical protein KNAG_0L00310 [Kazachstania naganishii CBS 8797]
MPPLKVLRFVVRKVKSVLLLSTTVLLLFYYTFQNEIDILNSYAENELLPTISTAQQHAQASTDIHDLLNDDNEAVRDLPTKNRYFPLLVRSPESDPTREAPNADPRQFKRKYSVHLEVALPNSGSTDLIAGGFPANITERDGPMLERIKDVFDRSWSQISSQWADDPWPLNLVDTLETLYIFNRTAQFNDAVETIAKVDWQVPATISTLVNIPDLASRALGGLISAYELSGEERLLAAAKRVGDFILRSYDTPNRLPVIQYPWKTSLSNRFPYQESQVGLLIQMSLELTKLTQLTSKNEYFDAVSHALQVLWRSAKRVPLDCLFPSVVDASLCKIITEDLIAKGEHHRESMKSIDENLKFVYCQQLDHFSNFTNTIIPSKDYISLYDTLSKMVALTNIDVFATFHETQHDDTLKDLPLNSTSIFEKAMYHITHLMEFSPSSPMDLNVVPGIIFNPVYQQATNELEVQLRRDFRYSPESCLLGATMAYGSHVFHKDLLDTAEHLTESCIKLTKLFEGETSSLLLDGVGPNEEKYDPKRKIHNVLTGKYTGFNKEFSSTNNRVALRPNQGANVGPQKRTFSYIKDERFTNMVLSATDLNANGEKWSNSELPLWINDRDSSHAKILSFEIIESIFYLFRTTGDNRWRERGRELFQMTISRVEKETKGAKGTWHITELGRNTLPSYWFSQTLKYYYLLFEDSSVYSFEDYVISGGGHIFKRRKPVQKEKKDPTVKNVPKESTVD